MNGMRLMIGAVFLNHEGRKDTMVSTTPFLMFLLRAHSCSLRKIPIVDEKSDKTGAQLVIPAKAGI